MSTRINHISLSMQEFGPRGEAHTNPVSWTVDLTGLSPDDADKRAMDLFFRMKALAEEFTHEEEIQYDHLVP